MREEKERDRMREIDQILREKERYLCLKVRNDCSKKCLQINFDELSSRFTR